MKKRLNKKGFTIVELVIVIAVIAILAAVLIPTFSGIIKKSNESVDVQATREMNLFLETEEITDGVDSILDVYDLFDEAGFKYDNYEPADKGRTFYYDKEYNKILYVDDATGKVIYPNEHKDETQGDHEWFTLSMTIPTVEVTANTETAGTQTYTVASAGEYAYVIEKLNKSYPANTDVVINVTENLDMKGAYATVAEVPEGSGFTLNGNGKTIKNITSNTYLMTGEVEVNRKYTASGLIGVLKGSASITDVVFENVNVKNTDTGNVALLIGSANSGSLTISGVTIKNSTVVGHRSVGALVGMLYVAADVDNVTLENVNVKTVAGRSGLVFGFVSMGGCEYTLDGFVNTNSALSIYTCEQNQGEGCAIVDYASAGTFGTNATKQITSYSIETNGTKEYRTYGFNENAICCCWNPNKDSEGAPVDNGNSAYKYCYFILA